jgi:anti-sigma factor RsiW
MIDLQHPASETLYAYDDGGLPEAERRGVERHLSGCAWCRERLAHASELPRALKTRYGHEGAPAPLRAAVRAQIQPRPDTPSRRGGTDVRTGARRIPLGAAIAAAAVFAMLLAGVFVLGRGLIPGEPSLLAQLSGLHARMAQDPALIQKQGEPAAVAAWFQSTLQQKIHIPALSGLQLSGGRIDSIEGVPAAHVLYQQNGSQAMSLLVWRGAGSLEAFTSQVYEGNPVYVGRAGTTTVVLWPVGDLRYACVGAEPPDQMLELASHVWRNVSD